MRCVYVGWCLYACMCFRGLPCESRVSIANRKRRELLLEAKLEVNAVQSTASCEL